jgi:hypothetical protein
MSGNRAPTRLRLVSHEVMMALVLTLMAAFAIIAAIS